VLYHAVILRGREQRSIFIQLNAPTLGGRQKTPDLISAADYCAGAGVTVVVVHDRSKTSFAITTPNIPPMQKQKRPNNSMGMRNTTLSSESAATICGRRLAPRWGNQPLVALAVRAVTPSQRETVQGLFQADRTDA
jgi:hypothetical protein